MVIDHDAGHLEAPPKTIIEQIEDMEKKIEALTGENKNLHHIKKELLKENAELKRTIKTITNVRK